MVWDQMYCTGNLLALFMHDAACFHQKSNHHCGTSIYRGQTATDDSGIQLVVTCNWASQINTFISVGAVQRTREREKKIFTSSVNLSCPYVQTSQIMLVSTPMYCFSISIQPILSFFCANISNGDGKQGKGKGGRSYSIDSGCWCTHWKMQKQW